VVAAACLVAACGKHDAVATLASANGPVERQPGEGAWAAAAVGAEFFLGDAARTGDGGAELDVSGGAEIAMQPHTILRFGKAKGKRQIAVESGSIDLSGTGNYQLGASDVTLTKKGAVRVTAARGGTEVELVLGEGRLTSAGGESFDLELGSTVALAGSGAGSGGGSGAIATTPLRDAGAEVPAPDAGSGSAAPKIPPPPTPGTATVVAKGRVSMKPPGATAFAPLPPSGEVPPGATVRVEPGASATLTSGPLALALAAGARATIDPSGAVVLDAGTATASATTAANVGLPGGAIALTGSAAFPAELRLAIGSRETNVTAARGGGSLSGAPGATLALDRGEAAALSRAGAIRVVEAIPKYFDLRVLAGESFTVHDPKPPTAVQVQFGGACTDGGVLEVDKGAGFRTPRISAGRDAANVSLAPGSWAYRVRCTKGGAEGAPVASGRISVTRDSGTRPLPKAPGTNDIDADGRTWRISYQSVIPNLTVHARGGGSAFKLHLASGGKEDTFTASAPAIAVPGAKLHEGTYTYWVDRDGVRDQVSTLVIDFDQTAPQVYIESPVNGVPWSGDIDVRGAVLAGWTAAVDAVVIPLDRARRFTAKVGIPPGNALAIKLSHPLRGIHYYLRRPR
jgi:hypothetical protein